MGFDITTFIFEVINFGVLMVLLHYIAYRPLRRGITRRRARLAEAEAQVADARAAVEERQRELDRGLAEIREAAAAARAAAVEEGASERARIIEQARIDAESERARARTMVEFERQAAQGWVREATIAEGTALAGRLLLELAPDALRRVLLDELIGAIRKREDMKEAHPPGETIELATPGAAERAEVEAVRAALGEVLGRAPELSLREAPELIAGWVLRVGADVLDASIAGELTLVREHARRILGGDAHA